MIRNYEAPINPHNREIVKILEDYEPQSNVQIGFDSKFQDIALTPYRDISRAEMIQLAREYVERVSPARTFSEDQLFLIGRENFGMEHIGGVGTTTRDMDSIEALLPGLTKEIESSKGKIVVLGNGLSTALLDFVDPDRQIVLVDIFDYQKLLRDLENIAAQFQVRGIPLLHNLELALTNCRAIVEAAKNGKVATINHVVGSGDTPEVLKNAQLLVNTFGPDFETLSDWLTMVAEGGKIFASVGSISTIADNDALDWVLPKRIQKDPPGYVLVKVS